MCVLVEFLKNADNLFKALVSGEGTKLFTTRGINPLFRFMTSFPFVATTESTRGFGLFPGGCGRVKRCYCVPLPQQLHQNLITITIIIIITWRCCVMKWNISSIFFRNFSGLSTQCYANRSFHLGWEVYMSVLGLKQKDGEFTCSVTTTGKWWKTKQSAPVSFRHCSC